MSITVADNFQYKGGKPLDARMKFSSVANMVATPAADLYDGCFAYVTATKKYYSYDSANTSDPTLGKWVEYSGGGSLPIASANVLGGVKVGNGLSISNSGVLSVDGGGGGGGSDSDYTTTEQEICKWIDGKALYKRSFVLKENGTDKYTYSNGEYQIGLTGTDICFIESFISDRNSYSYIDSLPLSSNILITFNKTAGSVYFANNYAPSNIIVTLCYTKSSDSSNPNDEGTDTDYSTTEHEVCTWIDGNPLYERTYVLKEDNVDKYTYSGNEYYIGLVNTNICFVESFISDRYSTSYEDSQPAYNEIIVSFNKDTGRVYFQNSHSPKNIIITLRYTKAS